MKRYLGQFIKRDLSKKIVLLTGPRQVGKTSLSKMLEESYDYFNYDNPEDRSDMAEKTWDRSKRLIIFDELHKLKNWKSWLKGVYDKEGVSPALIVTGSAKLDTYRKVGDSLAGRFFQYRLHPLDLKEIHEILKPTDLKKELEKLLEIGGFPEPYLSGDQTYYNRWKRSHLDIIIKQDLIDIENVQEITSIETMIQLLRKRVGSPVSFSSLARDLQCSDKTVKRWLTILEDMYVIFRVTPYHRNIARSILKSPKFYFYDAGQVVGDSGVKLENLLACALHKEIQSQMDCLGVEKRLYYLRSKDGKEVDFCIVHDEYPSMMIEAKWSDGSISAGFRAFERFLPDVEKIQIVGNLDRPRTSASDVQVRHAHEWLATLKI